SGPQVLNMAVLRASLDIFEAAGMGRLTQKAKKLSSYLHFVLEAINDHNHLQVITPATEKDSGCQVSIRVFRHGKHILEMLKQNSVIADWKEPDVVRIAAVPLYNQFEEIYHYGQILKTALESNNTSQPAN